MLLAIDIGNTNIIVGLYDGKRLGFSWRISTDRMKTSDEYGLLLKGFFTTNGIDTAEVSAVIISSVVPPVVQAFEDMSVKYFGIKPIFIGPGIKSGLVIKYENPKEVGADRIVNAVAAFSKYGGPLIVVDFGTATTFCAISAAGEYLGGAIAPGIGISSEALFQRAAKLPRVEFIKPETVIGKNTVSSMQSGFFYGFIGQVNEIVRRMKEEIGEDCRVIATGGLSVMIGNESEEIDHIDLDLTLEGLRIIYEKSKGATVNADRQH